MAISMLKIRRPLGRLIFNMGIAIPGKTVFLIETAPCFWHICDCNSALRLSYNISIITAIYSLRSVHIHTICYPGYLRIIGCAWQFCIESVQMTNHSKTCMLSRKSSYIIYLIAKLLSVYYTILSASLQQYIVYPMSVHYSSCYPC